VVRAGDDHRSRAIVGGIVELARAMGLHSVAEGVETVEQLEVVEALGCEVVQGFVYARPCPPEQLTDWLATRV
jgi:EAL domain-containing protein (putative c-di-GMP-specific phosphodiesterase class I)